MRLGTIEGEQPQTIKGERLTQRQKIDNDDEDENDWSFVIKLHALVEAAVAHLLTEQLSRPELSDLFAHLDISNKTTGKAAFV